QRAGKRPYALLEHPRFRAAYDFFVLRAESGEIPQDNADWWTHFQNANGEERGQMLLPDIGDKKRRRRRRKKPSDTASAPDA
ncbi:MAG TPA: polynucleotide adenylyltransferase PcnB, partial [Rhodocyclaceae bacterium]|nr:polynucleotide adenylyltransferase PcnB [Rhodocyclaceae bacterium]